MAVVSRFEIYLLNLDVTPGRDPKNTRPCVVISPDELNKYVDTVIVAPLSSSRLKFPTRIPVSFLKGERSIVLDQIRTVDKSRLVKKIGILEKSVQGELIEGLSELFAE